MAQVIQLPNRITTSARGARASTGIMASASGIQPVSRYSFNAMRSHSIFAAPLGVQTRLQSGRVSLTAEPNSAPSQRHVATQTGIHAVAASPYYPPPSPLQLGRASAGGTAQSPFGIPTVRGSLVPQPMPMIPLMQRKVLNARFIAGQGRPSIGG